MLEGEKTGEWEGCLKLGKLGKREVQGEEESTRICQEMY